MIKRVIKELLVAVYDGVQDIRHRENEMKIRCIQDILPSGIHPHFFWDSLAHGTAAVPAGVVMDLYCATVFTNTDVGSISPGFTVYDVISSFGLFR